MIEIIVFRWSFHWFIEWLSFSVTPEVMVMEEVMYAAIGQSMTFGCIIMGEPIVDAYWTKTDGKKVTTTWKYTVMPEAEYSRTKTVDLCRPCKLMKTPSTFEINQIYLNLSGKELTITSIQTKTTQFHSYKHIVY